MATVWLVLRKVRYLETDSYGARWAETINDVFVAACDSEDKAYRLTHPSAEDVCFHNRGRDTRVVLGDGAVVVGKTLAFSGSFSSLGQQMISSTHADEAGVVADIRKQINDEYYVRKYEVK